MTIIAGLLIAAYLCYTMFRTRKVAQEELDRYYQICRNRVTMVPVSKGWVTVHLVLMALLCALTVYVSQHPEQAGADSAVGFMLVCAALILTLILNLTFMKKYQELYISKDGFNDHGKNIRFSGIKSIQPTFSKYEIELYSGQSIKVSKGKGDALIRIMQEKDAGRF